MHLEVPHTHYTDEYLRDVFSPYTEIDKMPEYIEGRCIIHMYPVEDSYDKDGNLRSYCDAYLCHVHIYDVQNLTVFKTIRRHDEIDIEVPCCVRVFKDLSTMVVIRKGGVRLSGAGNTLFVSGK